MNVTDMAKEYKIQVHAIYIWPTIILSMLWLWLINKPYSKGKFWQVPTGKKDRIKLIMFAFGR